MAKTKTRHLIRDRLERCRGNLDSMDHKLGFVQQVLMEHRPDMLGKLRLIRESLRLVDTALEQYKAEF